MSLRPCLPLLLPAPLPARGGDKNKQSDGAGSYTHPTPPTNYTRVR